MLKTSDRKQLHSALLCRLFWYLYFNCLAFSSIEMCDRRLVVLISLLLGNWLTPSESYSLDNTTNIMIYFGSGSSIDPNATVDCNFLCDLTIGDHGAAYLTMNPLTKLVFGGYANVDFMRGNISLLSGSSITFGYDNNSEHRTYIEIDGQLILEQNATFVDGIMGLGMDEDSRIIFGPNVYCGPSEIGYGKGIWLENSTLTVGASASVILDGFFYLKDSAFHIGDMGKLNLAGTEIDLYSSNFTMGSGASIEVDGWYDTLWLIHAVWTMGNGANLTISANNPLGQINTYGNVNMGDNSTLIINVLWTNGSITIGANSILIVDHDCEMFSHLVVPAHTTAEICEFLPTCSGCSSTISEILTQPSSSQTSATQVTQTIPASGSTVPLVITTLSEIFTQPSSSQTSATQVTQTIPTSGPTVPLVTSATSEISTQPSSNQTSATQVTQTIPTSRPTVPLVITTSSEIFTQPSSSSAKPVTETEPGSTAAISTPAATKASCSVFAGQDTTYSAFKMLLAVCMSVLQHRMFLKF